MPSRKKKQKTHHTGSNSVLSQAEIWDDSALIRSWNDALAEYEYYHSIHARGEDVEEILRKAEAGELDDEDEEQPANGGWQPVDTKVKPPDAVARLEGGATVDQHGAGDGEDEEGEIIDEEGKIVNEKSSAKAQELLRLQNARKAAMQTLMSEVESSTEQPQRPNPSSTTAATQERPTGTVAAPMIGPSLPPAHAAAGTKPHIEEALPQAPSQDQTLENIKMAYYWAGYYSGLYDGQRGAQSQAQPHKPT